MTQPLGGDQREKFRTVADYDYPTGDAPPFHEVSSSVLLPAGVAGPAALETVQAGKRLGDFELLRLLGTGSFGRVFLARQSSLGRLVALKVTACQGQEGRTLARLEHDYIVQVFSETDEPSSGFRLLCMQYIPGATLGRVIEGLARRNRREWSGRAILDALDEGAEPVALDPAALRDRVALADCDFVEAVCLLGTQLAEALAHAHGLGILHRDVKPANVLLNRYGRPLLADFNIACGTHRSEDGPRGGTLAYMSPEHIEAFVERSAAAWAVVDERSDLYSLGMVLYELLTGGLPASGVRTLRDLAKERRARPLQLPPTAGVPNALACLVHRALDSDPEQRYSSAAELAKALDGCRELLGVEKTLPRAGPLTRALCRWPFALGCLLLLLPQVLGSVVNIAYNALCIVDRLTPEQQAAFRHLVLVYNAIVYPVCVTFLVALVLPVRRVWLALGGSIPPPPDKVSAARRRALRVPLWVVALSCVGWLPGAVLFPVAISHQNGAAFLTLFGQFLISLTISGLIALTYSFFATQFIALRILYPMLWTDAHEVRATTRAELAGLDSRLTWFQGLAVLIPLAAAVLMVGVGPEEFREGYRTFRLLVTALIALGMLGLGVTTRVSRLLQDTLTALIGIDRR
jgi:serine/threonine protein kinase